MKDLNELRRRRGAIIKDMRALTDKADAEKRELTAEENDQYSRMESDQERLRVEIEREDRQQKLDRELETFDREPGRMPEPAAAGERNANPRGATSFSGLRPFGFFVFHESHADRGVSGDALSAWHSPCPPPGLLLALAFPSKRKRAPVHFFFRKPGHSRPPPTGSYRRGLCSSRRGPWRRDPSCPVE